MVQMRGTVFFQQAKAGWTEHIHFKEVSYETCAAQLDGLCNLRFPTLADDVTIQHLRLSDDEIPGDVRVVSPRAEWRLERKDIGMFGTGDQPHTCALVKIYSGHLYRRNLYMRGLPDDKTFPAGQLLRSGAWWNNVVLWVMELRSGRYAIRVQDREALPYKPISLIETQAPNIGRVHCTAHGLPIGGRCKLIRTGLGWATGVLFPYLIIDADTIQLVGGNVPISDAGPWPGKGWLHGVNLVLKDVTGANVEQVTHRMAGRPFGSPVGRRKRR
jgi:hypothetical protein